MVYILANRAAHPSAPRRRRRHPRLDGVRSACALGYACAVAIGRAARRAERVARVEAVFGAAVAPAVLDLLELTELAWHDCYAEITPPEDIVDDILFCSGGDLRLLVQAARLAVEDWRDLKVWAETVRTQAKASEA